MAKLLQKTKGPLVPDRRVRKKKVVNQGGGLKNLDFRSGTSRLATWGGGGGGGGGVGGGGDCLTFRRMLKRKSNKNNHKEVTGGLLSKKGKLQKPTVWLQRTSSAKRMLKEREMEKKFFRGKLFNSGDSRGGRKDEKCVSGRGRTGELP